MNYSAYEDLNEAKEAFWTLQKQNKEIFGFANNFDMWDRIYTRLGNTFKTLDKCAEVFGKYADYAFKFINNTEIVRNHIRFTK